MNFSNRFKNGSWLLIINTILFIGEIMPWFIRINLLKIIGLKAGKSTFLDNKIYIKQPWKLRIGKNTTINRGVEFYSGVKSTSKIIIGNNCAIAPNVKFYAAGHDPNTRNLTDSSADNIIGNNVWIGANSIILQGVTVGDNAIVGAGSLVNKDLDRNCIFAGVPAIFKRERVIEK